MLDKAFNSDNVSRMDDDEENSGREIDFDEGVPVRHDGVSVRLLEEHTDQRPVSTGSGDKEGEFPVSSIDFDFDSGVQPLMNESQVQATISSS